MMEKFINIATVKTLDSDRFDRCFKFLCEFNSKESKGKLDKKKLTWYMFAPNPTGDRQSVREVYSREREEKVVRAIAPTVGRKNKKANFPKTEKRPPTHPSTNAHPPSQLVTSNPTATWGSSKHKSEMSIAKSRKEKRKGRGEGKISSPTAAWGSSRHKSKQRGTQRRGVIKERQNIR